MIKWMRTKIIKIEDHWSIPIITMLSSILTKLIILSSSLKASMFKMKIAMMPHSSEIIIRSYWRLYQKKRFIYSSSILNFQIA
jgi:hypothetical protein